MANPSAAVPLLLILSTVTVWAQGQGERVEFLRNLEVAAGEQVTDAVCIGCSIRIDGTVTGDAVAVGGAIEVSGNVQGDAVAVGSSVTFLGNGSVSGDCVAVGGSIRGAGPGRIGGDSVSIPLWVVLLPLVLAVVIPLVVLALIIWIVLVLVRRSERTPQPSPPGSR